jgi:hypothetical protein
VGAAAYINVAERPPASASTTGRCSRGGSPFTGAVVARGPPPSSSRILPGIAAWNTAYLRWFLVAAILLANLCCTLGIVRPASDRTAAAEAGVETPRPVEPGAAALRVECARRRLDAVLLVVGAEVARSGVVPVERRLCPRLSAPLRHLGDARTVAAHVAALGPVAAFRTQTAA